jgi:hypothetical protein
LLFAPRRPTRPRLAPAPPGPRSMIPRVGQPASVSATISGGAPPWSWSWPRARAGRSSPHHAATSLLPQIKNPSSLKGDENVKGGGGLKGERWKVGLGHWCGEWVECICDAQMYRRLSLPSRCAWWRVRLRWRLGGGEAARTTQGTLDAERLAPKKGVVFCAIAIAAVQHAQDADAGPRLQLASSRQRRRGAAGSCGAGGRGYALRGARRERAPHFCKLWTQIL